MNTPRHPQILYSSCEEASAEPPDGVWSLPGLLAWQATRQPHQPLFSIQREGSTAIDSLTYGQGLDQAHRLATSLARMYDERSIPRSRPVAIWLDKSIELHLAILATTFAGAPWLPFDQEVPVDRVSTCLDDSSASILLCDKAHYDRARTASATRSVLVLPFDDLATLAVEVGTDGLELSQPAGTETAYMIYTSGSTGTPKGIAISHLSAVTFACSERSVLGIQGTDVVWQGFSPAFDMFIEEVWVSIAGGAHLWIGNPAQCRDVESLGGPGGVWAQSGITVVNAVPTLVNIMTSLGEGELPASVRLLNLGGEACPPALVERLSRPSLTIANTYGPTETTVTATYDLLEAGRPVTIGKPLPFYHAVILDHDTAPVALVEGTEGQLGIGGPCVGIGYVGRPDLTADKFIAHPLIPGQRLYLTGDRVRLAEGGKLAFVGRIDHQVKHRGFRIELGEIESVLSTQPCVQVVSVICARAGREDARLEAYVVLKDGHCGALSALQGSVKGLPAYMRPEHYVFLRHDEMPRLASGKVNLNALHAISNERAQPKVVQQSAVKDEMTPLEVIMQAMRETFPQAASNGTLTPTADFFCDLGGHSLVAAVLVSRIRKMARVPLKTIGLGDVYSMRTAQALADYYPEVSVKTSLETSSEESVVIPSTHRPVSRARYTVCAIAQLPALALLAFINGLGLLTPYFVFDLVDLKHGTGWAILAAYATFVILPVFTAVVGIIGKWAVLGRAKEGRYPLYGLYYYRWWLAGRLTDLIEPAMVADSPLYSRLLRVLGAQIGTNGHFSAMPNEPCLDLISIGDDVVIGKDVVLTASIIEGGELVLQRITIGNRVNVGAHCVLEGGSRMEDGSKLESLSMLPAFTTVPAGAMWGGSPARFTGSAPVPSPEVAARPSRLHRFAFGFACALLSTFVIPLLYLAPQVPGLLMFVVVSLKKEGLSRWAQMGLLALPASVAYIVCVFLELVIARRLILGRMRPGTHRLLSFYMLRKWLVDRLMDLSLIVLHPVHATLYVVPYLRALGVQIGHGAEVSNIRGLNFELTEIGDQSFLADNVLVGEAVIEGNSITYEKTKLEARAFAGNSALLPQGITLPSNSLVGVLSLAPRDLAPGQSSFGSPPIRMPKRPLASANHPDHLLFRPGAKRVALRLFIEGTRIWLPRFIIIVALAFGLEIFKKMRHDVGHYWVWVMLPVFDFCLFSAPAIIITVTLKWILVGGYVPSEWPLWSVEVWLSEFVTSLYESLLAPILLRHLVGTPFLNMILRMMGADIGSMCTLLSHDMTEWDMVSMGDEAVLNLHAGPQTHLFEDRVMRVNKVTLARRSVMKPYAICLPDSNLGEESELGSLSLVMRGEAVPPMEKWNGIPIRRKT